MYSVWIPHFEPSQDDVHERHASKFHEEHEKSKAHCAEQVLFFIELTGRTEEMYSEEFTERVKTYV